jgi:branched-chain amino acid transport system substrate-binding protein
MRRKIFPFLLVSLIAVMFVAACSPSIVPTSVELIMEEPTVEMVEPFRCADALGCVDVSPGEPIHIAWIQTVSGITAPLGQTNVNGAQVALNEINFELLGHPIQWDGQNSYCSVEGGQAAATIISSDPTVVGVIGTTCSDETRGAMPLISAAGMVMISSSNISPDLTNPEHPDHWPGYLRTVHSNLVQGRMAAEFVYNELHLTRAATINDRSPSAEGLQDAFASAFTELGGSITIQEGLNVGDTEIQAMLDRIIPSAPQLIYFPISEPEGNLIAAKKCDIAALENTILVSADGLLTNSFAPAAGACAVAMYLTGLYVDPNVEVNFLSSYADLFGENPATEYAPHSYDAVKILLAAIEAVAVSDADGTIHIPRQALRDALYATTGFQGLTGALSCDANGDCASDESLAIFQVTQQNVDGTASLVTNTPYWRPGIDN